ncbi:hypothetical protein FNU79_14000 [Deinococcus detaillensis]|uniref:Protein kinase domain-containing protein n=1 Tax=Deinococcus detaillensis TaxID=2592048 RepID=A0A553UPJ9_9DEIO|nr:hypothetical protein [Deinococcus detaillensis]TSA82128.1 hypothetical protein FNU79_14000 [Deinococcus detaillensis]
MNPCPNCARPTGVSELHCPICGEVQLALPVETRLYHRYRTLRALRRTEGGLSYLAEDETHQRQVLLLEFFPVGSRRLGTLAILPEGSDVRRTAWTALLQQRTDRTDAHLQRPHQVFEQHGTHYAVTALPLGESLQERVQSGKRLDAGEALNVLTALAQGLQDLQRHGRIDGQLGPHRVSLLPSGARLDLGWAEEAAAPYWAPEQLLSPPRTGPASDVYALAALTLFALTGEVPPTAGQRGLGQPLPVLPTGVPALLRQAIEQSLILNSAERLPDAAALLRLLSVGPSAGSLSQPGSAPATAVRIIPAHRSWLTHLHSDGQRIVTAGADLRLRVFDREGQPLQQLDGLQGNPVGVWITDEGLVAGDDSGTLSVWSGNSLRSERGLHRITHLVVRGKHQAVTIQDDGALGVWNVLGPRQLGQVPGQPGRLVTLHVSHDDTLILGTGDGQLQLFNEAALHATVLWQHPERRTINAVDSAPSGFGLVAAATGGSVTLVDKGRAVLTLAFREEVSALAFSPGGTALVAAGRSGGLYLTVLQDPQPRLLYRSSAPLRVVCWMDEDLLLCGNEAGQLLMVPVPAGS